MLLGELERAAQEIPRTQAALEAAGANPADAFAMNTSPIEPANSANTFEVGEATEMPRVAVTVKLGRYLVPGRNQCRSRRGQSRPRRPEGAPAASSLDNHVRQDQPDETLNSEAA